MPYRDPFQVNSPPSQHNHNNMTPFLPNPSSLMQPKPLGNMYEPTSSNTALPNPAPLVHGPALNSREFFEACNKASRPPSHYRAPPAECPPLLASASVAQQQRQRPDAYLLSLNHTALPRSDPLPTSTSKARLYNPSQISGSTSSLPRNPNWIPGPAPSPPPPNDGDMAPFHQDISAIWFENASATRINTDMQMYKALCADIPAHPGLEVLNTDAYMVNILAYVAATGDGWVLGPDKETVPMKGGPIAHMQPPRPPQAPAPLGSGRFAWSSFAKTSRNSNKDGDDDGSDYYPMEMYWTNYFPPLRRLEGGQGAVSFEPQLDRYLLQWRGHEFEVITVDARDGTALWMEKRQYIRTFEPAVALDLIRTVGNWQDILHDEIWVFDQGFWQKSEALYAAVQKSRWADIILPEQLKEDLLKTVLRFYDSRETYERLRVPWKRGLIMYGPPGNGKTVSIKATMKTLLDRKESIPTLYVKSLASWAGPEASITMIFEKARQQAPCYLVFEDLDSLVSDAVRSFFLNAVDGLSENEGILMVGSTNHLERLDPGIAKRPSRFDRKYLFPDPAIKERRRYCQYWQKKLKGNDDVVFPDELLSPIAKLMDGFSFAYMQEAFVSTLLKIANDEQQGREVLEGSLEAEIWDVIDDDLEDLELNTDKDKGGDHGGSDEGDGDEFDKYVLWREIKVQIANLKREIDHSEK